jgi:hypothetical protein
MAAEEDMERDEAVDRFWDQVTQGRLDAAGELDPADAALIRYLHAADDRPGPTLVFRRHLREELMHALAVPLSSDPSRLPLANGRANQPWPPLPYVRPPAPRRWALAQLATAAFLMLTLVGSFFAFGPGRPGRRPPAPVLIPALSATPATPESAGVATNLLLDLVIPTLGTDEAFVQLDRYTFPPATTMDVEMQGGRVPEVFFLTEGELDVRADDAPEPMRVIRSGGMQAEEALASGEAATLLAGDAAVVPENGAAVFMNQAAEPAVALLLLMPSNLMPPGGTAIEHKTSTGNNQHVSAPLRLILERVTLAPDAALPGADDAEIESIIDLVDPDRVMDARVGSTGSLRNAGDEPLEAYVLTMSSDAAGS